MRVTCDSNKTDNLMALKKKLIAIVVTILILIKMKK